MRRRVGAFWRRHLSRRPSGDNCVEHVVHPRCPETGHGGLGEPEPGVAQQLGTLQDAVGRVLAPADTFTSQLACERLERHFGMHFDQARVRNGGIDITKGSLTFDFTSGGAVTQFFLVKLSAGVAVASATTERSA